MLPDLKRTTRRGSLPGWVPVVVRHYLEHTETHRSIRAVAREHGCHPSTILRQVRKCEARRDEGLCDQALRNLGAAQRGEDDALTRGGDGPAFAADALRVLRRLCEANAVLAWAQDMANAVVVRDCVRDASMRTAIVPEVTAQSILLRGWMTLDKGGRVSRYVASPAGRAALQKMAASGAPPGFAEAQTAFGPAASADEDAAPGRIRYSAPESPLLSLARRRGRDGRAFLSSDLVAAGERLREDFELGQIGSGTTANWDAMMTAGIDAPARRGDPATSGPAAARQRVERALEELGPGLGDVALRCCCYLEGLEQAERRMRWSARSGKVVLRIALQRLRRHYQGEGAGAAMIG